MIELLLQAERALGVGLLDQAEALYGQAAAADPRSAIAVVGLAQVALARGDEQAGLELARRALAIDPEDAVARRLVPRLEEILAYRGEAPAGGESAAGSASTAAPSPSPVPEPHRAPPSPGRRGLVDRLFRRKRA